MCEIIDVTFKFTYGMVCIFLMKWGPAVAETEVAWKSFSLWVRTEHSQWNAGNAVVRWFPVNINMLVQ